MGARVSATASGRRQRLYLLRAAAADRSALNRFGESRARVSSRVQAPWS
jgi:hypothetical protein